MFTLLAGIAVCGFAAFITDADPVDQWCGFAIGSTAWVLILVVMV